MSRKENIRFFTEVGGKQLVDEIKAYDRLITRYDRKFAVKKRASATWIIPGGVQRVIPYERGVRFRCQNGWIEIRWVAANCLRFRLNVEDGNFTEPFSYAVSKVNWPIVDFEITHDTAEIYEMRSAALVCRVNKRSFQVQIETLDGQPICTHKQGLSWQKEGTVRLSVTLQPDESSYGMGERAYGLQLRGKRLSLWNVDPPVYERGSDPLYYSIPFYLGVRDQLSYGMFWDNSSRGTADIGMTKPDELVFEAESSELRYYVFAGDDVKDVIGRYTELTGRIALPPLWTLGYHQSRFSYYPQETVLALAQEFRKRSIPGDVIYLDIHYMSEFRSFTWDSGRFPQFSKLIDHLHKLGFKVIVILNPGINVDSSYLVCKTGVERKIFLRYPDGENVRGVVWPGQCYFPDFTDPAARAWWIEQITTLIKAGVDGIWNDMCEPSIFTLDSTVTLPDYVQHNQDGLSGTHLENHNVYGMLMGRASLEGLQKHRPAKRQFNIIRAGFAGAQRYGVSWTGDNSSDWDHLRLSISMALNMGLSGAPITGPDVGGFNHDATAELFTRWMQAACLMPFFRSHTTLASHAQEPWAFGQPYEVINRLAIELRYRLLPYLYAVVAQSKEYGWPVIRPIFMAEPHNPQIRSIDDSFMLGDALLVAPVLEAGAVRRRIYLPEGEWYDYWTNELLTGGQYITIPAPLERLPLFVRAGTVLPHWPVISHIGEKEPDTLIYRVYPGEFETVLYEDQGEGLEFENGNYRWVYVTCAWDDSKLIINRRIAGRYVPAYKTIKVEVVGFDEEPQQVRVDRQGAPLWFYDDGLLELTIDDFQRIEIMRKSLPTDRTIARRPW